MRPNGGVTR